MDTYRNSKWPEAVWDVSGAFAFDKELISFYDFCKNALGIDHVFPIVHGSPLMSPWNSGRVVPCLGITPQQIEVAFQEYTKRKISIYFTFSNHRLEAAHLSNRLSNDLCTLASRNNPSGGNAVILASDLLNGYIKAKYPQLKRISSILKIVGERGRAKMDVYKRYLDEYDMVMMHPDDVLNLEFIDQLPDKERIILLINEYCVRNCPIRHWHYDVLSSLSINPYEEADAEFTKLQANNGCTSLHNLLTSSQHGTIAQSDSEIEKLYQMGFRHFKLQGRGIGNAVPQLTNMLRLILRVDGANENSMHAIQQLFWEQYTRAKKTISL